MCDNEQGSFLTVAFKKTVEAQPKGKGGFLTWPEFFSLVKAENGKIRNDWLMKLPDADRPAAAKQVGLPVAFELPGGLPQEAMVIGFKLGAGVDFLKDRQSIIIRVVHENSPAARVGIEVGDEILAVNGQPIGSLGDYERLLDTSGGRALLKLRDRRTGKIFYPNVPLEPVRQP
jgi:membrane-associated protease RseP (regulator of RpoE activity)